MSAGQTRCQQQEVISRSHLETYAFAAGYADVTKLTPHAGIRPTTSEGVEEMCTYLRAKRWTPGSILYVQEVVPAGSSVLSLERIVEDYKKESPKVF